MTPGVASGGSGGMDMGPDEPGYGYAAVARILDVPESKLRYWVQVGLCGPSMRPGGRTVFSFRDLVAVKVVKELTDRGVAPAEIRRALATMRTDLPGAASLARLRVAFDGQTLLVLGEGAAFEVTGQRVFDFGLGELAQRATGQEDVPALGAATSSIEEARKEQAARSAYDHFVLGLGLAQQPGREADAMAAYERALALDPGLAAARTNWGALAYARGDTQGARTAFEAALALDPEQTEARFNLANILLEENEHELAAAELRRVLLTAPDFADAHYNLATALEALGSRAQAREHLLRYLGLVSSGAAEDDPWVAEAKARLDRL